MQTVGNSAGKKTRKPVRSSVVRRASVRRSASDDIDNRFVANSAITNPSRESFA